MKGNANNLLSEYKFLSGGGEMGALTRAKDWSKTPVGAVAGWPQSLRTTLGIILNSKFPMFLWWGPELVCFYNDAYRPSLGQDGKHPSILGIPATDAWPEIWHIIKPLIDQVLGGGNATWSEDQLIPIFRNGHIEDVYWTFSYSPVNDESGTVAGVLVTCTETTDKVNIRNKLEESRNQLQFAIDSADLGTWDIDPATSRFTGNDRLKEWHGLPPESEFDLETGFSRVIEKDREPLKEAMAKSLEFSSGGILDHEYSIVNPFTKKLRIVRVKGKAAFGVDKIAYRLSGILQDVTEQVAAWKEVEESEQNLLNMAMQAPIGICVLDADSLVAEIVNDTFIEIAGKPYEAIIGKFYWDSFAEARPYHEEALSEVVEKGITYYANEVELLLIRHGKEEFVYVTFVYAPLKNAQGKVRKVAIWVLENTQQVKARQKIEAADKRFRDTVRQAPIGITILRGPEYTVEMANDSYLALIDRKEAEFIGRRLFDSLPEVESTVRPLLENVLKSGAPFHGIEYPIPVNRYGKYEISHFNFLYHPLKEEDGKISGIIVTVTDVSESVKAKHSLAESEKQFRNMVIQSPVPMAIFRGPDHIIELANTEMFKNIWRKEEKEIVGKKLLDVFPELADQKYPGLLRSVYLSGNLHREKESIAYVEGDDGMRKFYFDYEYKPLFETDSSVSGIMITLNDVTEKVEARQKIEENEEKLNIVIEASELGTWELNLVTDEMNYSPRYLEIFGYGKHDNIPHADFVNQIHPDDILIRGNAFEQALKSGRLNYELRMMQPSGSIRWIEAKGKVFYTEEKKPIRLLGTIRDITDEKSYQEELKEREQKFRLLADSMPQFVWTSDAEGKLNYFNQSVYKYSGLSPEKVFSDGWIQIVHPDDREENISSWIHSVSTGEDFLFEHRFRRHDGAYRWQLSRAIPQRDAAGNIQMWVGSSTDIQEIKELDQQKDYFISMASHELKTPITSIKGYVQLLQTMYLEKEDTFLKTSLRVIDKQIITLTNLISDLLDLSKIKSGSLILNKEDFAVNELVREVIDEIEHVNPEYHFIFSGPEEMTVHADRERIGQVLRNFLTNAVKYSPASRTVKVSSLRDENNVIVSVEDAGIGISKTDQEKIFERFYRVEGKNEKTFPGFGIGLFIASEIVRRHHGKIGVESEQGKGSVFYFSLSLNPNA